MKTIVDGFADTPGFIWGLLWAAIRGNDSRIASLLRKKLYRTKCTIDTDVFIKSSKNFTAGTGSCLYHGCYILNTHGKFVIGNHSHLGAFCYVNACYGSVIMGNNVAVGPGTKIIAYSNHYETGKKVTQAKITEDVVINNNVLIGADCTVLPGAIIPDNVVIGAGSVVKGKLEGNSIYAGAPCKKIKTDWYE